MGECLRFGIKSVPQTASAWVKRSKARVPFTSWCCNIVIGNGSRVMIMGVTYMFNIFIKISRAMSLIYFMTHIKLPFGQIVLKHPFFVLLRHHDALKREPWERVTTTNLAPSVSTPTSRLMTTKLVTKKPGVWESAVGTSGPSLFRRTLILRSLHLFPSIWFIFIMFLY